MFVRSILWMVLGARWSRWGDASLVLFHVCLFLLSVTWLMAPWAIGTALGLGWMTLWLLPTFAGLWAGLAYMRRPIGEG
jgi:hypothetical protein